MPQATQQTKAIVVRDPNAAPKNGDQVSPAPDKPQNHGHEEEGAIPKDLPKPSNVAVAIGVFVFVALLAILFLVGWYPHHKQAEEARADAADAGNGIPVVNVQRPKPETAADDVLLPATSIQPFQDTLIYTRANGYLKKLYKDIGDTVVGPTDGKPGELMAEIETPDVDAQLAQAKASLEQAKTNVTKSEADRDLAWTTLNRYVDAQKNHPGSVTQEDVDTKKSAYDDAVSAVASAKAAVTQSEAQVQQETVAQGFEKIYAPFSGTVTSRNYDVGALLSPTSTKELFHVAETDVLRVFVNVPQVYATNVKTGQEAYLLVRNFPGREFKGTVARTAGALDPVTRTLAVQVNVDNSDGVLFANMFGRVRLPIPAKHPVLVIPSSALVFNATGSQVAVVKDGKVHFQKIDIGRDLGTELEIATGVTSDDMVVANPGEKLSEGGEVTVVDEDKAQAQAAKPAKVAAVN